MKFVFVVFEVRGEVRGRRDGELVSVSGGGSECGLGECGSGGEHRAGDSRRAEQQPEQARGSVAANEPAAEERGAMGGSSAASCRGSGDSRASTGGTSSGVGVEQRGAQSASAPPAQCASEHNRGTEFGVLWTEVDETGV